MLLRRFADDSGYLHFIDKRNLDAGVQRSKPENLLLEKHIYSRPQRDGKRDSTLEIRYSRLESVVSPILDEVTQCVLRGIVPKLSQECKRTWDLFLYEQWRRVPDMHEQIMPKEDSKIAVLEAFDEFEGLHRKLTAEEREKFLTPTALANFRQNARVGALSRVSDEILTILGEKGLYFATCEKRLSFIIGSSPVIKIVGPDSHQLDDSNAEVWLPIHPNIAAVATGRKNDSRIVQISSRQVRAFNLAVARKSSVIASRSNKLISALIRNGAMDSDKAA